MSDPRRSDRRPGLQPHGDDPAGMGSSLASERDAGWPAHPWAALLERLQADEALDPGSEHRSPTAIRQITVIWWKTAAGRQPVILIHRRRLD